MEANIRDRDEARMMMIYIIYLHSLNSNIYRYLLPTLSKFLHSPFCSTSNSLPFSFEDFFFPAPFVSSFSSSIPEYPSRIRLSIGENHSTQHQAHLDNPSPDASAPETAFNGEQALETCSVTN